VIVFNLTDVPSKGAQARGWVNTHLRIGQVTIAPGKSADVPKHFTSQVQEYEQAGAAAVGKVPEWYTRAKAAQASTPAQKPKAIEPTPVVQKTTVVPSSVDPVADTEPSEEAQDEDRSRPGGRRRSRGG
jgi:hypothetical protein